MEQLVLFLMMVLILCSNVLTEEMISDWHNYLPWAKDMSKENFGSFITLQIVKKNWMPEGYNAPEGDKELPRFSGNVKDAYTIFNSYYDKMFSYEELPLETAVQLLKDETGYVKDHESIFIIPTISNHPWSPAIKNTVIALALRKLIMKKYNVFVFCMPNLRSSMEKTIGKMLFGRKGNLEGLGETLGEFFNSAIEQKLITLDQIHILGFCYASQLAGYVARYISSKNSNKKIKSITGLDLFSMGLFGVFNKVLSKEDAQVVQVYHTNSIAIGSIYRKATVDVSFNSGWMQPGCYTSPFPNCSHWRAVTSFWYVILYPQLWVARKCPNWIFFKTCLCNARTTMEITFPPTPGVSGSYYMNTLAHKPYAYGPTGANCYTKNSLEKAIELTRGSTNL